MSKWTIPNLLTLARILAIVPLVAFIDAGWWIAAFVLFVAAAATDWLDGWLARRWNQQSDLGRMLDPIADKLIVAAVLVALIPESGGHQYPLSILAILVVLRELLVSGMREYLGTKAIVIHVSALAKWKTALQLVSIGLLLVAGMLGHWGGLFVVSGQVEQAGMILLFVSTILAWVTAWSYLRAGLGHMEPPR